MLGYGRSLEADERVQGAAPPSRRRSTPWRPAGRSAGSSPGGGSTSSMPTGSCPTGWWPRRQAGRTPLAIGLHGSDVFLAEKPGRAAPRPLGAVAGLPADRLLARAGGPRAGARASGGGLAALAGDPLRRGRGRLLAGAASGGRSGGRAAGDSGRRAAPPRGGADGDQEGVPGADRDPARAARRVSGAARGPRRRRRPPRALSRGRPPVGGAGPLPRRRCCATPCPTSTGRPTSSSCRPCTTARGTWTGCPTSSWRRWRAGCRWSPRGSRGSRWRWRTAAPAAWCRSGTRRRCSAPSARLLADPAAARAMGERGRRKAEAELTWDAVAARYREGYRMAVGDPARSPLPVPV